MSSCPAWYSEEELFGVKVIMLNTRMIIAILLDKFTLTPETILHLTDRQILDFYFHPRDKHGAIREPIMPAPPIRQEDVTFEEALMQLEILRSTFRGKLGNYEEAREVLLKKIADQGGEVPA